MHEANEQAIAQSLTRSDAGWRKPLFLDIQYRAGRYSVTLPSGVSVPLCLAGEPIGHWQPGWMARRLYCGLAPLFILEFDHADGNQALWWLDEGFNHLSLTAEALPAPEQIALASRLDDIFERLWIEVFADTAPALSRVSADFMTLAAATRRDIAMFWAARSRNATVFTDVSAFAPWPPETVAAIPGIKLDRLRKALDFNLQDASALSYEQGAIAFPSVYTASNIDVRHSICLDSFRFLYRVPDHVFGQTFYVGATGHHCVVSCILCVSAEQTTVFHQTETQRVQTRTILFDNPKVELLSHLMAVGTSLVDYFTRQPAIMVNVQRSDARHMGHLLWNELTGISETIARVNPARLPWVVIPNARDGGEMYGPVDRIFPELQGLVIRRLSGTEEFKRTVYSSGWCVLRSTSLVVKDSLRRRFRAFLDAAPELQDHRSDWERVSARKSLVVTLGLRVENRTFTDLEGCYEQIVLFLEREFGPITVVIDGHNAAGKGDGTLISSNQEWKAARRPIDVERSIVEHLKRAARGRDISIVDTVGGSIPESLFWISRSTFFVAPWGTGMAKYSWVCNLPGFVITSPWNRNNRGDIAIYEEPLSSGAAPLAWAEGACVRPSSSAPVLVEVAGWAKESYENFDVDMDALLAQLAVAIRQTLGETLRPVAHEESRPLVHSN